MTTQPDTRPTIPSAEEKAKIIEAAVPNRFLPPVQRSYLLDIDPVIQATAGAKRDQKTVDATVGGWIDRLVADGGEKCDNALAPRYQEELAKLKADSGYRHLGLAAMVAPASAKGDMEKRFAAYETALKRKAAATAIQGYLAEGAQSLRSSEALLHEEIGESKKRRSAAEDGIRALENGRDKAALAAREMARGNFPDNSDETGSLIYENYIPKDRVPALQLAGAPKDVQDSFVDVSRGKIRALIARQNDLEAYQGSQDWKTLKGQSVALGAGTEAAMKQANASENELEKMRWQGLPKEVDANMPGRLSFLSGSAPSFNASESLLVPLCKGEPANKIQSVRGK